MTLLDINDILGEIKIALDDVHNNSKAKRRSDWTNDFFEALANVGWKHKYKVYTSHIDKKIEEEKGGPAWLFDLCWSIETIGDNKEWKNNYEGLKLICESEWTMNEDEIIYDFQKLAVAVADIKLMIIQYNNKKRDFDPYIEILKKSISQSLLDVRSKYVLIGSGNGNNDNEVIFEHLN